MKQKNLLTIANMLIALLIFLFFIACTAATTSLTKALTPAEEAQQLFDAIQTANASAPFSAELDTNGAEPVIILTAKNTVAGLSLNVPINQEAGIITDPTSIIVTATNPIAAEEVDRNIMLIAMGSAEARPYAVRIVLEAAPLAEWLTPSSFSSYITGASFDGQAATTVSLSGGEISISGVMNRPNGAIVLASSIPNGYTLTGADALVDPDGELFLTAVTDGDAGSITIAEDGSQNSVSYNVKMSLEPYVSPVDELDIVVTDFNGSASTTVEVTISGTNISIAGLPNADDSQTGMASVRIAPSGYTDVPVLLNFMNPAGTDPIPSPTQTCNIDGIAHSVVLQLVRGIPPPPPWNVPDIRDLVEQILTRNLR